MSNPTITIRTDTLFSNTTTKTEHKNEAEPTSNEKIKIDILQPENTITNNNMEQSKNMTCPIKYPQSVGKNAKITLDMYFDNPSNDDYNMFEAFNRYSKKQLIYLIMKYELGYNEDLSKTHITTKEWVDLHEVKPKTKSSTKSKSSTKNSAPKPSAKHIYKALKHYDTFTKENKKIIDLINKTCIAIQLLKHPYEDKVFMIADFQTLHITTKDNKKPTLKHILSITNELGKNISKINDCPNFRGYGEPFKQFINSILNHEDYDEDDFTDEKITIAQLDKEDTFRTILRKEKSYNNGPLYINEFLFKYKKNNNKIKYLYNNTPFTIVNIDMFEFDDSDYGLDFWNKYTNYTGNITLKSKDEKVINYNWYNESMNISLDDDTNNDTDSNNDTESNNDTDSNNDINEEEEDIICRWNSKTNLRLNNFDYTKEHYGLELIDNEDNTFVDLKDYQFKLTPRDKYEDTEFVYSNGDYEILMKGKIKILNDVKKDKHYRISLKKITNDSDSE
jgi:hypothetical protein